MMSGYFAFEIVMISLGRGPWNTQFLDKTTFLPKMPMGHIESEKRERQHDTLLLAGALLSNFSVELQ